MTRHTLRRGAARRAALALATIASLGLLSSGPVQAETLTVAAVNFRFEPQTRTASVGDVVRWTFAGDPHTVTSGAPGAPDEAFSSGIRNPGDTYQITLTSPGTFRYFCEIHPEQMFGTIVVSGGSDPTPGPTVKPTARPTARPTVRPTPVVTAAPTAVPSSAPSGSPETTPLASASATPASTRTPNATPAASSPAASRGGAETPQASIPPDPGTAAVAADPAPILVTTVVLALVGGGLLLARRSGRI